MEFLSNNLINTTTQIAVDSATDLSVYLYDKNPSVKYVSEGYGGATATTISISFTAATVVSNVLIQNHNLSNFEIYYNGTTTNSLFSVITNTITSTYVSFASMTVNSIHLKMDRTISTTEKQVGELVISEKKLDFERLPDIKGYKPVTNRTQVNHRMPDGGFVPFFIKDKFQMALKWKFLSKDFKNDLWGLFRDGKSLYFVENNTTTSWDGLAYNINLIGDFDFNESHNVSDEGFSGSLMLKEVSSG